MMTSSDQTGELLKKKNITSQEGKLNLIEINVAKVPLLLIQNKYISIAELFIFTRIVKFYYYNINFVDIK